VVKVLVFIDVAVVFEDELNDLDLAGELVRLLLGDEAAEFDDESGGETLDEDPDDFLSLDLSLSSFSSFFFELSELFLESCYLMLVSPYGEGGNMGDNIPFV
jgi:hypothetical protein